MPAKQTQHVVAVPLPAQGHLNPLMRFCTLLAKQEGFIVTFVDLDLIHQRQLANHEVNIAAEDKQPNSSYPVLATSAPSSPRIRRARIPTHGLDLSNDFSLSFCEFFGNLVSIAPYLEQLILSLNRDGPPVTCLLSDFFTTFPTQDVADKLGIPRIVLFPCCASRLLFMHYLLEGELITVERVVEAVAATSQRENVFCKLPGLPTLLNRDIPHYKHVMDETRSLWTNATESWKVCITRAHSVVVNSFGELEASTFTTLGNRCDIPIYAAGFWVEPVGKECATSLWKEDNTCMSWLDQQPTSSVLYISFGSITLLSQTQFEEFLNGLLSSQQRFLWVFRPGLVDNIDHTATVADIISKSQGRGLVINWAPQLQVLSHPSLGGFLTHCGWNSTTESIAHGVPMLCWPYFADQTLNARCIVDEWKVGLQFESSKEDVSFVQRGEIERVIRALMEGPEGGLLRENATRLKEKSWKCLSEDGSSSLNLQALIQSLCT